MQISPFLRAPVGKKKVEGKATPSRGNVVKSVGRRFLSVVRGIFEVMIWIVKLTRRTAGRGRLFPARVKFVLHSYFLLFVVYLAAQEKCHEILLRSDVHNCPESRCIRKVLKPRFDA